MNAPLSARGYALVSVLWLVVLLTGITAAYHAQARVEARLLTAGLQRAQAEALAEAGLWIAAYEHFFAATPSADLSSRAMRTIDFDGTVVTVSIADVSGLINLNGAPPERFAALLAARSGLGLAEQAEVVDAILDWRDSDRERSSAGAEDADYAALNLPYGAKDAPFATVDELRLVRGTTPAAYRALAPTLTVFGNHARINPAAAPPEVVNLLPRDDADVGAAGVSYDQQLVQRTGEGIYAATAEATVGAATVQISATIRNARGEQRPVQVLAWSSAPAVASTREDRGSYAP